MDCWIVANHEASMNPIIHPSIYPFSEKNRRLACASRREPNPIQKSVSLLQPPHSSGSRRRGRLSLMRKARGDTEQCSVTVAWPPFSRVRTKINTCDYLG